MTVEINVLSEPPYCVAEDNAGHAVEMDLCQAARRRHRQAEGRSRPVVRCEVSPGRAAMPGTRLQVERSQRPAL